jgi:hypothetical protein
MSVQLRRRTALVVPALLWLAAGRAVASRSASDVAAVPRHLAIARDVVEHVRPEDNRYVLGGEFIRLGADSPGAGYAVRADCSGFLLALFARAGYATRERMTYFVPSPKRKRPAAEDFVASIEQERGFVRIASLADIRPGDLLAHAMLDAADKVEVGTTGHVFLIDSVPVPIRAVPPVVRDTRQHAVLVIDSNNEHLGADDTRLADPAHPVFGVGRGTIRLYSDASGTLVGWSRTFRHGRRFFSYSERFPSDTRRRKAAIGRPA